MSQYNRQAWLAWGMDALQSGDLTTAAGYFDEILARDPGDVDANRLMGLVARERGELDSAITWIEHALASHPDHAEATFNLGTVRWARGDIASALACFDDVLARQPDHDGARLNKGAALRARGDRHSAAAVFREATRRNPQLGGAWYGLASVTDFADSADEAARMHTALTQADPRGEAAKNLHFALGKARADQGQRDAAVAHYMAGNALMRQRRPSDIHHLEALLAEIARQSPASLLDRLRGGGLETVRPIFILGMPRAGSSLVEQILASHPRVAPGGERGHLEKVVAGARLSQAGDSAFPAWMPYLARAQLPALAKAYLGRLPEPGDGRDRITDKVLNNFRFLGLIHLMLPNAAILHVHRSPADTCLSCYCQNFAQGHAWSFDQTSLGRYYRAYSALMQHWRAVLPGGAFLDVRYEDLVRDPETEIARLLSHCGLAWDDQCLHFHEAGHAVHSASKEQVREPLYTRAMERWRAYAPYLGPLFTALGDFAPSDLAAADQASAGAPAGPSQS